MFSIFNRTDSGDTDVSVQAENVASNTLAEGTVVYDVRTEEEFAAGHAQDSVLLPLADIQSGKYPAVAKDDPIAVYCRSGNRSGQATAILKQAGYTNITDIGAFTSLQKYGLQTVR